MFPAISLGFTILLLLRSYLYLSDSPSLSSSSAFPAISLGFTFFFFFCVLSCISGVYHFSFSSCVPSYVSGVHLLLLRSQLYLRSSSSSSSEFPAISMGSPSFSSSTFLSISLGFTFFFFFCVPSCISGGFPILLLLLRSQLYLWGSPSSSAFPRSFESERWNACVHRLDLGSYFHPKEFWGEGSQKPCELQREKNPIYGKLRGGSNPRPCNTQDSELNTLPTELFRPPGLPHLRWTAHSQDMEEVSLQTAAPPPPPRPPPLAPNVACCCLLVA